MPRHLLPLAAASLLISAPALAQDYKADLTASLSGYLQPHSLDQVTLNVACRHLPAMDFIEKNKAVFEQYSGAKINFTDYPENDLRSHIVADASNKAGGFQIYCLDNNYVPLFSTNNWILPIGDSIKPAYKLDDIYDNLLNTYKNGGRLFGLPIYSEVTILYYRKDLFQAAGLAVPQTIADLETDAAKLTQSPRTFGIALRGLRGEGMNVYIWTEWLRSYGGDFLDDKMHPVFDQAPGVTGTTHYGALIRKSGPPGSATWGWPQVSSSFAAGRVAMTIESTAFYPVFNDPEQSNVAGKVGYAVVPAGPDGHFPANYSIGLAVAASAGAGSKIANAAATFLQWATSQNMEMARATEAIANEDRKSVGASPILRSKFDQAYIKAVSDSQAITKKEYRPMIPQWREMGDIIGAQVETAFTGSKTPQAALTEAATEVTQRFKDQGVLGQNRPYTELFPSR